MRAQAPVARSSCRFIYRRDKGGTTRIHRSRDRCRLMPAPEPKASTPPTSSASDWRLLARGPPSANVERRDRRRDGQWPTPGTWSTPSSSTSLSTRASRQSAWCPAGLSCQPARDAFWTASRQQMSRASRPAHSQCSAIGQNCRCRLVFEFSYFLSSIFHLLDML